MRKKLLVCMVLVTLLFSSSSYAFAANTADTVNDGMQQPRAMRLASITSAMFVLKFTGSTANVSVYATPKVAIDYVTVSASLYKTGSSSPVKTWPAEKIYADSIGDFNFMKSGSVTSKGTYYFTATIKTYRNGSLLEEFTGESANVTY